MSGKSQSVTQKLYKQLRGLPPAERHAFLYSHYPDQPSVIAEVIEMLKVADEQTMQITDPEVGFSPTPPMAGPLPQQTFAAGDTLAGRFVVLRFISSGGMGEVYAAEDLKLGGNVAIKTIRSDIASDPFFAERFRQEISISRRITHPNVCRVFDLASHGSGAREVLFLTMELLEGESLAAWMEREGPISIDAAGPIVRQMLEGLSAAHRVGVIHQDFKPNNVFLVPDGEARRAVVMDFGLARPMKLSSKPVERQAAFGGTPSYMAPEQFEGKESSVLSDIYSVGLVLYEMVTGQKPFKALGSGSKRGLPVPPRDYVPKLDEEWDGMIRACLAHDPGERPQSVEALMEGLGLDGERALSYPPANTSIWRPVVITLLLTLAASGLYWLLSRPGATIQNAVRLTSETDLSSDPSLSRDGKLIAYTSDRADPGNQDVWIQTLPGGQLRRITSDPAQEYETDLSADGKQVAFRSDRDHGGIYLAQASGGKERLLVEYGRRPKFSPDGKMVAYWTGEFDNSMPSGRIYIIPSAGGQARQLVPEFADAREPLWSPDGQSILFNGCRAFSGSLDTCQEWWVKRLDGADVIASGVLANLRTLGIKPYLDPGGWYRVGVLFSATNGGETNLWRAPISPKNFLMSGKAERLTSINMRTVNPSMSDNGTVAFGQLTGASHIWQVRLDGGQPSQPSKVTNGPDVDSVPSVSRDGRLVAFVRGREPRNVWLRDMDSGREWPIGKSARDQLRPLISPDGSLVAFVTKESLGNTIHVASLNGQIKQLCSGCENPTGWFDGHRGLLVNESTTGTVAMVEISTGKRTTILTRSGFAVGDAVWSDKSQRLLFTASRNRGPRQVFSVGFPQRSPASESEWVPLTEGNEWCDRPQWSADGETAYYLSKRDNFLCIWAQRINRGSGSVSGLPVAVAHFHNPRWTPDLMFRNDSGFSVSSRAAVLNVGEASESIWLGTLSTKSFFGL